MTSFGFGWRTSMSRGAMANSLRPVLERCTCQVCTKTLQHPTRYCRVIAYDIAVVA
jgi:hypothetical protein